MKVAQCKQGFKYFMVKSQAGFLYADDVCLMASNEQHLKTIFDNISRCIKEYGLKINGFSMNVMIWKYGRMEWDDGFGMLEMLEMN